MITQDAVETIPREALKCKKCNRSGVTLKSDGGRRNWCLDCIRAYYAGYRKRNQKAYALRMRDWRSKNREKAREQSRRWGVKAYRANPQHYRTKATEGRHRLKNKVYAAYGGYCCTCCGETTPEFLTIDHVNNDGAEHRKKLGRCGNALLLWLKKNGFPSGFQILCWNCQWGKRLSGLCPHQRTRND